MAGKSRYEVDSEASSDGDDVKPSLSDIDFEPNTDHEDGDSMGGGNSTDDSFVKLITRATGDRIGYACTDDEDDGERQDKDDEEAQKDAKKANAAGSTSGSSTDSMDDTSKGSK